MLKETWDILDVYFKDWNKKLALLLNDDRYLWNDTLYMFKPAKKENEKKPELIVHSFQIRLNYEPRW